MKKRSQEREINRSVELGRKNADLYPRVQQWCKHIKVEMTSGGMLAQFHNLPIGMLRVTCAHGQTFGESMHLDVQAKEFILHNCIGCAHHSELSSDSYGHQVIKEKAQSDQKRHQAKEEQRILRQEFIQQAQQSLDTKDAKQLSVNALILQFHDIEASATDYHDFADQLYQTVNLAPEFFTDAALRVLLSGLDEAHIATGLKVAIDVCSNRKNVPRFVFDFATQTVQTIFGQGVDAACGILLLHASLHNPDDLLPLLKYVIEIAGFQLIRRIGSLYIALADHSSNALSLSKLMFTKRPTEMKAIFDRSLRLDDKMTKLRTAKLLHYLLPEGAGDILPLTDVLLYSLELEDDIYDDSADHQVCELVAHLFAFSPEFVNNRIEVFWPFASDEVKELLVDILSLVVRHASSTDQDYWSLPVFPQERYVSQVPNIIDRMFLTAGDIRLGIDERSHIAEKLEDAVSSFPEHAFDKVDRLLGRLAMTIHEADQQQPPKGEQDFMQYLEYQGQQAKFSRFIQSITKAIRRLIQYNPESVFPVITKLLGQTSSDDQPRFKAELVSLLSDFSESDQLVAQLIPELYRHLTDFKSNLIRAAAIKVTGTLLNRAPESVPSNMLQLIVVYLQDTYVIIHKTALQAIGRTELQKNSLGWEALSYITNLEIYYSQQPNETHFVEEILRALSTTFREWPEVKRYIVVKLLPKYSNHSEIHFADGMLSRLAYSINEYPEVVGDFLDCAVSFIKKTRRDRYGNDNFSDRRRIFDSLFSISREAIVLQVENLQEMAIERVDDDPLEACQIVGLISSHGFRENAIVALERMLEILPDVKSATYWRDTIRLALAAEKAEKECTSGDFRTAYTLLNSVLVQLPSDEEVSKQWNKRLDDSLSETL